MYWQVSRAPHWFWIALWFNDSNAVFRFSVFTKDGVALEFGFGNLAKNLVIKWGNYSKGIWLGLY